MTDTYPEPPSSDGDPPLEQLAPDTPDELPAAVDSWLVSSDAEGQLPPGVARRRRIVRSSIIAAIAVIVIVAGVFIARAVFIPRTIVVPTVTGLDVPTARSRLGQMGLRLQVAGERFSATAPSGSIVEQSPRSGARLKSDGAVSVYVSAGVDTFAMPDVIGLSLEQAQAALTRLHLFYEVVRVAAKEAAGTVLSTIPSPGTNVSTADDIRLTVSSGEASGTALVPEDLTGKTFVVDPGPTAHEGPDIPLEVTRRLRALLEASGAIVRVTRSVSDTALTDAERQKRALDPTATALVAVRIDETGPGGLLVSTIASTGPTPRFYQLSTLIARATTSALTSSGFAAHMVSASSDPVLLAVKEPALSVDLGSYANQADARSFSDPAWADAVARAMYRGCAAVFRPVAPASGVGQNGSTTSRP